MSSQNRVTGYGFVRGKLGQDGVVEKCDMYNYPHVCTPRWCSPPPEGHPPACPKCGATQRTSYLSACWTDTDEWHGGVKVPPVAEISDNSAHAVNQELRDLRDKLAAAESELREMREAVRKQNVMIAELLARKAGS